MASKTVMIHAQKNQHFNYGGKKLVAIGSEVINGEQRNIFEIPLSLIDKQTITACDDNNNHLIKWYCERPVFDGEDKVETESEIVPRRVGRPPKQRIDTED